MYVYVWVWVLSGRTQWPRGPRPHACWVCGFEPRREHRCPSLVSVVCCQVEVSASGWSLVQRSPTECVSECDREASIMMRPWPTGVCCTMKRRKNILNNYSVNVITLNISQQFKLKPRREYLIKLFCCYTDVVRWTQCAVCSLSPSAGNRIHAMMLISQVRGWGMEH